MKLPIFAYGNNVLKVKAQAVASDFPNLHELIANMWETMEKANGLWVGSTAGRKIVAVVRCRFSIALRGDGRKG